MTMHIIIPITNFKFQARNSVLEHKVEEISTYEIYLNILKAALSIAMRYYMAL